MQHDTSRWSALRIIVHLTILIGVLFMGYYYWPQIITLLSLDQEKISAEAYIKLSAIASTVAGSMATAIHAYDRRIQTTQAIGEFFKQTHLMTPPQNRIGYSDRMAYILAEMSELAYYEVEQYQNHLIKFFKSITNQDIDKAGNRLSQEIVNRLRDQFSYQMTHLANINKEQDLIDLLSKNEFEFIPPYINHKSVQGFICRRAKSGESPYIVVAFRGSEKKIQDWLTNADAMPHIDLVDGKVHSGFYDGLMSIKTMLEESIAKAKQKYINEGIATAPEEIPVFFTGHSLGGALATVAIRELNSDGFGAAYTFGAPRVGDYEYFYNLKAPVFRLVNSSDIVPRVPPGAYTSVMLGLLRGTKFVFAKSKMLERLFDSVIGWLNKLKDYRHFGDLRYLTDTAYGASNSVQLLTNPSRFDRVRWFWRHILVSFGMPVKSHSMQIYRNKLTALANRRNP